jgi:predicted metal-dependent HD superfamily phosphohydrolase
MNWTKIADTELGSAAWDILDYSDCEYHNGCHVLAMYEYLHKTDEPYDEALDWAVLFHDIVYDALPEKELRSAKIFVKMVSEYSGCELSPSTQAQVYSLIMRTTDHAVHASVVNSSAIIRADLHALTSPLDTFYNFQSIMDESMNLYNINEVTFVDNNIKFMGGLYDRVQKNMETDPDHREFYKQVMRGIVSTMNLARILKGDL